MNITGKTMIFAKEFDGRIAYSRSISWHPYIDGKVDMNKWERIYEPVKFTKDVNIPNKTLINITKSFESGFFKQSGEAVKQLIIQEFEIINDTDNRPEDTFSAIDYDSPF